MRKFKFFLFVSAVIIVALVILAFLYVDFSAHEKFQYDILFEGKPYGSVVIDKYVTEDKIIYKAREDLTWSLKYPVVITELFLKRRTKMPIKYAKQSIGIRGSSRELIVHQNEDKTDLLFIDPPKFISVKELETGYSTVIFSPYDMVLYVPIMERYNFWKKGTQFFEILIPMDDAIPPLRDKLEVRYEGIEYVPAMNRRIESHLFAVGARSFPEAKVGLSKYSDDIVFVDLPEQKMQFILTSTSKSDWFNTDIFDRIFSKKIQQKDGSGENADKSEELIKKDVAEEPIQAIGGKFPAKKEEIFFESDKLIMSGTLYSPEAEGSFPAVVLVQNDGPITKGEANLFKSYAKILSESGYIVLEFNRSGQGKSQGNFTELDDERRVKNIVAAVKSLEENSKVDASNISMIGFRSGGYLALKASQELPSINSCIILGIPFEHPRMIADEKTLKSEISLIMKNYGLNFTNEGYMNIIVKAMKDHTEKMYQSKEPTFFFLGKKMFLKPFKEYLDRDAVKVISSFDRPVLLIFARDDKSLDPREIGRLDPSKTKTSKLRISELRTLKPYFGEFTSEGEFKINSEVLRLISGWLEENKKVKPVESIESEQIP